MNANTVDPRLQIAYTTRVETPSAIIEQEFDTDACRLRLEFGRHEYTFVLFHSELAALISAVRERRPTELSGGALRLVYHAEPPAGWRCMSLTHARNHRIPAGVLEALSMPPASLVPARPGAAGGAAPWPNHQILERLSHLGLSADGLAAELGVKPWRMKEVLRGERRIGPIEEFIAGKLGASRLAIFGPNGREKVAMAAAERRSS